MNLRPSGYEPDELPDCSTPRLEDKCSANPRPGQSASGLEADAPSVRIAACSARAGAERLAVLVLRPVVRLRAIVGHAALALARDGRARPRSRVDLAAPRDAALVVQAILLDDAGARRALARPQHALRLRDAIRAGIARRGIAACADGKLEAEHLRFSARRRASERRARAIGSGEAERHRVRGGRQASSEHQNPQCPADERHDSSGTSPRSGGCRRFYPGAAAIRASAPEQLGASSARPSRRSR